MENTDTITVTTLLFSILGALISLLGLYLYQKSQYWKKRGVISIGNVFLGDFKKNLTLEQNTTDAVCEHYKKYKHLKFTGSFVLGKPMLFIHDPKLIKEILTKDVQTFGGRGLYYDLEKDPLSANLLFLEGADWKSMRTKLTPAFTSGKIKYMFGTVLNCISKLEVYIEKARDGKSHIDIDSRDLMARLATDVILSVTLGITANSVENPESHFRKIGKLIFDPSISQFVRFSLFGAMHSLVKLLNIKLTPKETNDFFIKAIKETIAYREANNVTRNDFLDLMIRLKNYGTLKGETETDTSDEYYLTVNQITAQAFLFYIAGFETTSSTLSFTLFEIAKHPEILTKIQQECDVAMKNCGEKVNYETVQSLEYIEMVVQEGQRLHPAVAMLNRSTLKDCTLPGTSVKLDKNTGIVISVQGLHLDPDYFPHPDRFDPDRFSSINKKSIPSHVYMPFGEGPRNCIGLRFAMMQIKATILQLLYKYDVELGEGTPRTVELDPRNLLPAPKHALIIKFKPRKNNQNVMRSHY